MFNMEKISVLLLLLGFAVMPGHNLSDVTGPNIKRDARQRALTRGITSDLDKNWTFHGSETLSHTNLTHTRFKRNDYQRPMIREIRSENNGDTWTFKGSQALAYSNMTHNYINTIPSEDLSYMYDPDEPLFDTDHSSNVTALKGKTSVLNCRVKNIGNKTVSWVRHRDIHLLTVGKFSYTSDQRFQAVHSDGSEDWLLKIHYLQDRDAGWYECQISATPPRSHMVYLSVVEPETVIVGGPDVYINTGSRLSLTCSVKYSPEPPAFIFWYHDGKLVSYDRTRGGVHVQTEKGHVSTSRLLVQSADQNHSGVYMCSPANSQPKTVNVHVLIGEHPAAIHNINDSSSYASNLYACNSPFKYSSFISLSFFALSSVLLL